MTKIQRKILQYTGLLGTFLTLAVICADNFGGLIPIENWEYDQRARHCQYFVGPPSDDIRFIDIDDRSLDRIGRWPWERGRLARVVDQIQRAGAKVICLDILLSEPQAPIDGVDQDGALARVLRESNRVLVPCSFTFDDELEKRQKDREYQATFEALQQNLNLKPEELYKLLKDAHIAVSLATANDLLLEARKAAVLAKLIDEPDLEHQKIDDLSRKLLPNLPTEISLASPVVRVVEQEISRARSIQELRRFSRPVDPRLLGLLTASAGYIPIPQFLSASRYSGFVDYLPYHDGVVRSVPLWADYLGRRYPHMGFVVACAMLGADPNDPRQVQITKDQVTIRAANGEVRVVPVNTVKAGKFGTVRMMMDIPWIGTDDWTAMFGTDSEHAPRAHYPISKVWEICEKEDNIAANNRAADDAIRFMLGKTDQQGMQRYVERPPARDDFPARLKVINGILSDADMKEAVEGMGGFKSMSKAELDAVPQDDGRLTIRAWDALKYIRLHPENDGLIQDLALLKKELTDRVAHRAVYVGRTATGGEDIVPTSLHTRAPGVVAHGAVTNGILSNRLWYRAPQWMTLSITGLLGLLTTFIVATLQPWKALAATVVTILVYVLLNCLVLFDSHQVIMGLAGPTVVVGLVWSGCTLVRYILEQSEKARITRRFRRYVDPGLVNYYLDNPDEHQLSGEKNELTMVFTDMVGFTDLSERLGEKVVPVISQYMSEMVPHIRSRRGYVNKFLGDGIMFFYNAPISNPNHAVDAVETVLAMRKQEDEFNRRLREQELPTIRTRFGVNTGEVIVGDAGPPEGSDYTALGDNCNLASRLEGANKAFGSTILISQRTADLLNGKFLLRPVGKIRVKGKEDYVMTYEPLAAVEQANDEQKQLAENSRKIVELYQAAQWEECRRMIESVDHQADPAHKLFLLYDDLCAEYLRQPPAEFHGGIVLSEK